MRMLSLPGLCLLLITGCAGAVATKDVERNKVYVVGSVTKQTMLEYWEGMTLLEAISMAQFPNYDAMRFRVRWVDKSGPVIVRRNFSYSALIHGKAGNEAVHPGDIIYFRRNPFFVFLDFIERLLRPVRSLLTPLTATTPGALGVVSTAAGTTTTQTSSP